MGKKVKVLGMEFGEGVLWKRRREGGPFGKMTCMWEDGVYLGMNGSTGDTRIADGNGIYVTRTVRRKLEEERWGAKNLEELIGFPGRGSRATSRT